jgi:hypothetical protein
MPDLACLLIPQEIFPQSPGITDTGLLRKFPCEINILRDLRANLRNFRASRYLHAYGDIAVTTIFPDYDFTC